MFYHAQQKYLLISKSELHDTSLNTNISRVFLCTLSFFNKLTCASEGVPEADREPEPLLHAPPPHQLLRVVVTEAEHLIGWSIRLVLDCINPCNKYCNDDSVMGQKLARRYLIKLKLTGGS